MERCTSLKRRVRPFRQNRTIGVHVSAVTRNTCRFGTSDTPRCEVPAAVKAAPHEAPLQLSRGASEQAEADDQHAVERAGFCHEVER
jgi:hypothetical protein